MNTKFNDFVAISNNTVNDNTFNAKKAKSTVHQLKTLLKSLLLKHKSTYKKQPQPEFYQDEEEINDNLANELLENEIFEEIDACEQFSGVNVYHNGHMDIMPVFRGQRYIPVHFARTEAGTFFWTSMMAKADSDISEQKSVSQNQRPQVQVDRWAQA